MLAAAYTLPAAQSQPTVLDTNVLIHIYALEYKPAVEWFASAVSSTTFIIPSVVLNEFMYAKNPQHGGFYVRKRDIAKVRRLLDICRFDAPVIGDYHNALARVSASYGKATLGFADALIAESVLRNQAQLCIFDEDFAKGVSDLRPLIVQPYVPPLTRTT